MSVTVSLPLLAIPRVRHDPHQKRASEKSGDANQLRRTSPKVPHLEPHVVVLPNATQQELVGGLGDQLIFEIGRLPAGSQSP